jgi:hypothetical protein
LSTLSLEFKAKKPWKKPVASYFCVIKAALKKVPSPTCIFLERKNP